eukprot:XP_008184780.1 PREDICTED: RNA-directed DNA polymerase from mobile element jockey-like [Acyrthosiphon pisum]
MSCGKCNTVISPAKSAVCITCDTNYHPVCTKLKTLTNYKINKEFWNCDLCLSKLKNISTRNKKTDISYVDESNLNYDLDSVKTDFRNVLQKIEVLSKNMLLWTAKEIAKNYNFKYTWSNSGGIFIRKQMDGQAFKISNLEILQKMDEEQKGYVCKNTITDHYTVILTLNKTKNGSINVSEIAENKKVERINFDLLKKLCKEKTWPISKDKIKNYILNSKEHNSFYIYGLTNFVLKHIIDEIIIPLEYIFNLSLTSGIFPNALMETTIIPLFKQGNKNICTNYRPISFTFTLAQVLEKCIKSRLYEFLDASQIFTENQFGFRKNKGTSKALQYIVSNIHKKLDEGDFVIGIFLDVKKAFDSVDHNLLLKKLENYGIRGVSNNLIKSFLTNRNQRVKINNTFSNYNTLNYRVPQGTVLGPLLFIVYINDLLDLNCDGLITCFADDTTILINDKNKDALVSIATQIMSDVNKWFSLNSLEINYEKTCISFTISKKTLKLSTV